MPSPPITSTSGQQKKRKKCPSTVSAANKHRKQKEGTTGTTVVPAGLGIRMSNIKVILSMLIHDNAEMRRRNFAKVVADFEKNMRDLDDPGLSASDRRAKCAEYEAYFKGELDKIKVYLDGKGFYQLDKHEYKKDEIENIITTSDSVLTSASTRPKSTNVADPPANPTKKRTSSATRTSSTTGSRNSANALTVSAKEGRSSTDSGNIASIDSGAPTLVANIGNIMAKIESDMDEDQKNFQKRCEIVKKEFTVVVGKVEHLKANRNVEGYEPTTNKRGDLEHRIHQQNRELSKVRRKYIETYYDFLLNLREAKFQEEGKPSLENDIYTAEQIAELVSDKEVVESFKKACAQTSLTTRPGSKVQRAFRLPGPRGLAQARRNISGTNLSKDRQ